MDEDQLIYTRNAIHKLQLALLEGISKEDQLFAAGSLISQSDYNDVVIERSIANICGYPLCKNPLPSERPQKGRYRISLKEHKVYDLQETYMYCSSGCLVNSRAFAGSLRDEMCTVVNSAKMDEVLKLFGKLGLTEEGKGKKGDLGLSDLKIKEKVDVKVGEVSFDDWVGPSNAIEGYVPQRDGRSEVSHLENQKEGSKPKAARPKKGKGKSKVVSEMDFTSTIIMGDGFNIPKPSSSTGRSSETKLKDSKGNSFDILDASSAHVQNESELDGSKWEVSYSVAKDQFPDRLLATFQDGLDTSAAEPNRKSCLRETTQLNETTSKSSLKSLGAKKQTRSVTWADEKKSSTLIEDNLPNVQETCDAAENAECSGTSTAKEGDDSVRFASAEACAIALMEAAKSVALGESEVNNAVSEAGIIILPTPQHLVDESVSENDERALESEPVPLKWPMKPENLYSELFGPEDSWYDTPPEGFNLTLSTFATMWMTLFGWITSSSVAYIYGKEESSQDEFLVVNGREYPHKIVLSDGRSSEIRQTLEHYVATSLRALVNGLRLPTPISVLEKETGRLLGTMSFIDTLPAFNMKQWHVVVLLFLDALSVCRVPGLHDMTITRILLKKVLDGAKVTREEYEVMKDLIIPLGRVPQFSAQSGG